MPGSEILRHHFHQPSGPKAHSSSTRTPREPSKPAGGTARRFILAIFSLSSFLCALFALLVVLTCFDHHRS